MSESTFSKGSLGHRGKREEATLAEALRTYPGREPDQGFVKMEKDAPPAYSSWQRNTQHAQ